ncbi:S8 family serine peptidase, partial [Ignavibacterium sp.]|uniref:S8 family serine peptidase n=1 Tax=Ignavibacterium sp. TaxID=2651167 RepID=UPI00307D666C
MKSYLKISRKIILIFLLPLILSGFNSPDVTQKVIEKNGIKYLSNSLVIKLKYLPSGDATGKVSLSSSLQQTLDEFQITDSKLLFPSKLKESNLSLSRIIIINYSSDVDPFYLSSKISGSYEIEWAEPKFVYETSYIPNDPSYASQYALSKINAALAWDINKGDTNIVIGIVDTGVDWDHPDLAANIWTNWNEIPNNGIDDDNNGYIDDVRGWDFGGLSGTPDNNPMEDQPDHGTHVAGIASAVTDNSIGVASIGFKTKLMPVKTTRNDQRGPNGPYVIYGYEGIVYAADNGAKVINCSWGGSGFSLLGQETINYATSQGSLVVAAAGNSNISDSHYPSSYKGVLSVASTTSTDTKSSFSNYGYSIDVSAPGSSIYNTWQNDTYATLSGTSMASPLTAGLAALVFSQFPSYNSEQVGEQIRVNTDNIDTQNPSFQYLLGSGRINAFKSLSNANSKSVRAIEVNFSDEAPNGDGDGIFEAGETISVAVKFKNYLSPTSSLSIQLEARNSYSTINNGSFNAGSVGTLNEFNNYSSKFTFTISSSAPQNAKLNFLLRFSDDTYNDFQWIETIGNPTYATQSGNDIALTITSKGTFAFNDYPNNLQGNGFKYLGGANQMFEGALILGTSATKISDAARGANQSTQNNDFAIVQPFVLGIPGSIADVEGSSVMNDNNAGTNKIGVTAKLKSYSFASSPNNNFIILEYTLINNTASSISNLYAGLFFDWDLIDGSGLGDRTEWDNSLNYGFIRNTTGGPANYNGVALLSGNNYGFYAIKNDGGDGGFQIYDGFDDSEKWTAISGGIAKSTAGPGDVSNVTSAGPFNISSGDSIKIAFAILAADNKVSLDAAVNQARTKYQEIIVLDVNDNQLTPLDFSLDQNYPNPFNPTTIISFVIPTGTRNLVTLKVYDVLGNVVATLADEYKEAGRYKVEFDASSLPSGVYIYKLAAGSFVSSKKMIVIK